MSFMEYPELEAGLLDAGCTDVFDRGGLRSIYLRDPDGHVVELVAASAS